MEIGRFKEPRRPREAYERYLGEQYQQLQALAEAVSFER